MGARVAPRAVVLALELARLPRALRAFRQRSSVPPPLQLSERSGALAQRLREDALAATLAMVASLAASAGRGATRLPEGPAAPG